MVGSVIDNPYTVKAGTLLSWPNVTIPVGWLVCDGSAVSRTTYKALFDAIGTTYGVGDGTTTFNLPNGQIPLGVSAPLTVYGNGKALGIEFGANGYTDSLVNRYNSSEGSRLAIHSGHLNINDSVDGNGYLTDNHKAVGLTRNAQYSGVVGTADLTNATCATKTLIKY